jgi:hypothetical protein
MVERARRATDGAGRNLCIARRGVDVAMNQQRLDDSNVGAIFQQMRGEAVPQCVNGDALGEVRGGASRAAGRVQHSGMDWMLTVSAWEQLLCWSGHSPVCA